MNLIDIYKKFPQKIDCLNFIQHIFHGKTVSCPYCGMKCAHSPDSEKKYCKQCRSTFTARTNTLFHGAKCDLQKWFFIIVAISQEGLEKSISYLSAGSGLSKPACSNIKKHLEEFPFHINIISDAIDDLELDSALFKIKKLDLEKYKKQKECKSVDLKASCKKTLSLPSLVLKATHSGTFEILGKPIPCAVLSDKSRVIIQKSVFDAFERPAMGKKSSDKKIVMPSFLTAKNLLPYISEDTKKLFDPVFYTDKDGTVKKGYKAEILPVMCDIYLSARKDGVLVPMQKRIGDISEMIVRGLAKVGIAALVDEATGYQDIRGKNALAALLDKYLNTELASWAKKFPDEFYKEMFRLKKWDWDFKKRPKYVGKLTNDIVYERIAPELVKELESRNPKLENGKRAGMHHQLLTIDVGDPSLSQHLHAIIGLMRISEDWTQFYRFLQRSFPKKTSKSLES